MHRKRRQEARVTVWQIQGTRVQRIKNEIAYTTNWQALLTLLGKHCSLCWAKRTSVLPQHTATERHISVNHSNQWHFAVPAVTLDARLMSIKKLGMSALISDKETSIKNEQVLSACLISVLRLSISCGVVSCRFIAQNATAETVTAATVCRSRLLEWQKLWFCQLNWERRWTSGHQIKARYWHTHRFIMCCV